MRLESTNTHLVPNIDSDCMDTNKVTIANQRPKIVLWLPNWPEPLLDHGKTPGWLLAQQSDEGFISTYAKMHPQKEDIAESFLLWLALRYRLDNISESDQRKILEAIPHRLRYFDEQEFPMYPFTTRN